MTLDREEGGTGSGRERAAEEEAAFAGREEWRAWLAEHGTTARVIWVVFEKKGAGGRGLRYQEAVEEALCFGWVDSLVKRIDDTRYRQKFTPRRVGSTWSKSNLERARRLIDTGRMTPAGLAVLGDALAAYERDGTAHEPPRAEQVSPELMALLTANPAAQEAFGRLVPSHRRQVLGWVMAARREATRERRMTEVVATLARGERLGLK